MWCMFDATSPLLYSWERDSVLILKRVGGISGQSWRVRKFRHHKSLRILDRRAPSQSLCRLDYPLEQLGLENYKKLILKIFTFWNMIKTPCIHDVISCLTIRPGHFRVEFTVIRRKPEWSPEECPLVSARVSVLALARTRIIYSVSRAIQLPYNPRELFVTNHDSIHNNNKVTTIEDYVLLKESFALTFEKLNTRFIKNSHHVI